MAAGDAVGTTVEFSRPGSFKPLTDMVGGGVFHLKAGEWTDDTSMALCIAESMISKQGFDPDDQLQNFVKWHDGGFMSCVGYCFDIGGATSQSLHEYSATGDPEAGMRFPNAAGNGALMRLAPVPMSFDDPDEAVVMSGESSKTTHGSHQSIDACMYFGGLIWGALHGASKEELLSPLYHPGQQGWDEVWDLHPEVRAIAEGDYDDPNGSGYVIETLRAALWAFSTTDNFRDAILAVANLGDDADTTAAVTGQLAGAFYGIHGIPKSWRRKVAFSGFIVELADELMELKPTAFKDSKALKERRVVPEGLKGGTTGFRGRRVWQDELFAVPSDINPSSRL
jgi:ADP-ribosylglycohydrolase